MKLQKIIVLALILIFGTTGYASAQVFTEKVQTRVGSPSASLNNGDNCPTKTGIVTNGSLAHPVMDQGVSYGHCDPAYAAAYPANCRWEGTKYAVDIAGDDFENVFLPTVNKHIVDWTYLTGYDEIKPEAPTEAILKFSGIDTVSGTQYYLQLHHQKPGSGHSGKSGELGGQICGNGCGERHVHVQIATGQNLGSVSNWMDAGNQIVCKNYP